MSDRHPLRILVVTEHFWPEVGGAEVMLRRLSRQWAQQGCKVAVLTRRWDDVPAEEVTPDNVRVIRLRPLRLRMAGTLWFTRQVTRFIDQKADELDVVYTSMLKHAAYASVGSATRRGLKCVLRAEGGGVTGDVAWQRQALLGNVIRRRCQKADAVVAPGAVIRQELLTAGYAPNRTILIPNGIAVPKTPWNPAQTGDFRRQVNVPERTTVCYTGRLHADKGVSDLVEACALLKARGTDVGLLIVGEGPEADTLRDLVERRGLHDRVQFTGQVDDVTPFLRASDLYVLPSYQEGLSVALLEAMGLGLPALASDIPENHLLDAPHQTFFEPRDPQDLAQRIHETLQGTNTDVQPGVRDLVRQRYSLESIASQHLDLFRELLSA